MGSLLWIYDSFRDANYDAAWTNPPSAARRLRTELLFHSLNDLFTVWDDMTSPHVPSSDRFQAAACGANSTLCVMLPIFPDSQQKLHHLLESWRKNHQLVLGRDTLLSALPPAHPFVARKTPTFLFQAPPAGPSRDNCREDCRRPSSKPREQRQLHRPTPPARAQVGSSTPLVSPLGFPVFPPLRMLLL